MAYNIVLYHPEIPQNTGNVGRLCVATKAILHLIEPLGYDINDRQLKRARLDYWQYLEYYRYKDLASFLKQFPTSRFVYFSKKVKKKYWDYTYKDGDFLVFGSESKGLPDEIIKENSENTLTIPQYDSRVRSLNLSNSASIVLYEALRQSDIGESG